MNYLFKDPQGSIFISNGYLEEPITTLAGGKIDLSSLSERLRILLVTDGTVTKTLEAMFWEPLQIELIAQHFVESPQGIELLERDVKLIGVNSGTEYAFARSYLATGLMPEELVGKLKSGAKGIGWLLRQMNTEQYRDIVEVGYTKELPSEQRPSAYDDAIFRTYCIKVGGRRMMQISEHFPQALYS